MHVGVLSYGLLAALAIALVVAAVTDLQRRQIDNTLNAAIALGAPLFWYAIGLTLPEIGWQIGLALAAFVVLAGLFAIGAMGGGDVKLLAALALWIRPEWFFQLVVIMALLGGLLTIVFGACHIALRRKGRLAIPYGVAISAAGLWVLASQYLPAFQTGSHI